MENLSDILFYNLDRAIRSYRQFAHQQLTEANFDITVDQWLVLRSLQENPGLSQHDIAIMTFKDHASLTRIIELLVKKQYLLRKPHTEDRRRYTLTLTKTAVHTLQQMQPIINSNRKTALSGISKKDLLLMKKLLLKISDNCNSK